MQGWQEYFRIIFSIGSPALVVSATYSFGMLISKDVTAILKNVFNSIS